MSYSILEKSLRASISLKEQLLADNTLKVVIEKATSVTITAFQNDKKAFFCGNGGSAADAQHLAAELSGRFYYDRPPLYAEALNVNYSYLTAVANDYGYDAIFSRILQAKGRDGDVLFALSTSGNSPNIINAIEVAKKQNLTVIGMTGAEGGAMKSLCDILINVPSKDTPRIQEAHMLIGHAICEEVELTLFPKP